MNVQRKNLKFMVIWIFQEFSCSINSLHLYCISFLFFIYLFICYFIILFFSLLSFKILTWYIFLFFYYFYFILILLVHFYWNNFGGKVNNFLGRDLSYHGVFELSLDGCFSEEKLSQFFVRAINERALNVRKTIKLPITLYLRNTPDWIFF